MVYLYKSTMKAAKATASFIRSVQTVYSRKWSFLGAFLLVLLVTVYICALTGFIPDAPDTAVATPATSSLDLSTSPLAAVVPLTNASSNASQNVGVPATVDGALNMNGELPTKIVIPEIGVSAPIANPATTDVNTLDNYLSYGAARYPTSATLDQQGNVILFGHSSYLPVIINQHYKTFDGIQNLKAGDLITVYSSAHVFTYSVTSEQQQSELTDSIPLTTTGHTLTLATCDSFAQKTDRFVVTATLVGSSPLGS
jgi:LPXTG-site transpeptidase (sortase) family protein